MRHTRSLRARRAVAVMAARLLLVLALLLTCARAQQQSGESGENSAAGDAAADAKVPLCTRPSNGTFDYYTYRMFW